MKRGNIFSICIAVFLVLGPAAFSQVQQSKKSALVKEKLKVTGYINVHDRSSGDDIFAALEITRGNKAVKNLKATLNGKTLAQTTSRYNYQGSQSGVTIGVGTKVEIKIRSAVLLSRPGLSAASSVDVSGIVSGVIRFIKTLQRPSLALTGLSKTVKFSWKYSGRIGSPVDVLVYDASGLVYEKRGHNGSSIELKRSLFQKGKYYHLHLLKPMALLKPKGKDLDIQSEVGLRYISILTFKY